MDFCSRENTTKTETTHSEIQLVGGCHGDNMSPWPAVTMTTIGRVVTPQAYSYTGPGPGDVRPEQWSGCALDKTVSVLTFALT